MLHRPAVEEPVLDVRPDQDIDLNMPVIPADALECGLDLFGWSFKQLHKDVRPADQSAGDVIAQVAAAGGGQNVHQHRGIETERA